MRQIILSVLLFILPSCAAHAVTLLGVDIDAGNRNCLVLTAWNEAKGSPQKDIAGVVWAIINRVKSPKYPKTVCAVVRQKGQFSDLQRIRRNLNLGLLEQESFAPRGLSRSDRNSYDVVKSVVDGILADDDARDPTNGATSFYSPRLRRSLGHKSPPVWATSSRFALATSVFRFYKV